MRISDWSSDVCSSDLRQTIRLPVLTSSWQTVPLRYVAGADAKDATFEVTGTGSGRFRVGVASLMPADNIHGWRADTVALLKSLRSGFWRLPGGNFLSTWDWHGAIGPRAQTGRASGGARVGTDGWNP